MVEEICENGSLLAIIVRASYRREGLQFFTPGELSQQLAFMGYPRGQRIEPHLHNEVKRDVSATQETLFIRKGALRVDFYDENLAYLESRILHTGDVILLVSGGHGFEVLEDLEMIEVKQGPYAGDADKTRFQGVSAAETIVKPVPDG